MSRPACHVGEAGRDPDYDSDGYQHDTFDEFLEHTDSRPGPVHIDGPGWLTGPDADPDSYANSDTYSYSHSDPNAYSDADSDADSDTDADSHSDSGSSSAGS